ncbi:hypothetical protein [Stenotrophomonas maltophilia group sp. Smal41]|uniref:hypothetical protein n=1 Tax=Stenotrophomonas maltophilia group sp. Smal41 TaxID=3377168 RepID=UPI00300EECBD
MADIVDLRGQHAPLSHRTCEARAYFLGGPDGVIVGWVVADWVIVGWVIVGWVIVGWVIVGWVESTVSRLSRAARAFHRRAQSSRLTVDSTAAIGWSAAIR